MFEPKYAEGEIVLANHSGKAYIVLKAYPLDEHGSFAYAVRGWRGGKLYGPTRQIPECGLAPSYTGHVGLQHP